MKFRFIFLPLICFFNLHLSAVLPVHAEKEKKETKLTVDQRLRLMTRELNLNAGEQLQVHNALTFTQNEKAKIKALKLRKKEEKARIEKIKTLQKTRLRKILGAVRYARYQKLKKDDVF